MTALPLYNATNVCTPANHLRFTWTGWPASSPFPDELNEKFWNALDAAWEGDGIRRLEGAWTPESIQLTFSVKPSLTPVLFTSRVKGRLQHALRQHGKPTRFSRKVAFRSIGDNHRRQVENYVAQQVQDSDYIDAGFKKSLAAFSIINPAVDLSLPSRTHSGRYWYDLHVVLVVENRWKIVDLSNLAVIRDKSFETAKSNGHRISRLSVLPDHWHGSLRGNIEHSPEQIALDFMNQIACALGPGAIWQYGYYVGTFGEFDMNAVRDFQVVAAPGSGV